ncbi:septation protein SepH [Ornithinimicrobium panacihumi]|uniref:septation protein SepH n=1 Tax=Ornithinimicrobium panacihumi TaxID=2008449 RepID=UPI003F88CF98
MQQLRFTELDEQGRLVLEDESGTRFALPVDDRIRAALRPRRVGSDPERAQASATPREVQAMIRAGQSAQEVATATGWELVRVQRFEGPVLAEREHVVGLAKAAAVRAHGRTDGSHTLDRRVRERLQSRGVNPSDISWDAARSEAHGPWTVLVIFEAGGRERRAAWHYDVVDRSIDALDDEARWLSEDEQALPGGLAGHPLLGTSTAEDESNDLMATMRARRQRRSRRSTGKAAPSDGPEQGEETSDERVGDDSTQASDAKAAEEHAAAEPAQAVWQAGPGQTEGGETKDGETKGGKTEGGKAKGRRPSKRSRPGRGAKTGAGGGGMVDEVLPLEDLAMDEATMGTPPAAHPRGSSAESPTPVHPDPEDELDVDGALEDVEEPEESVEGVYARTRHDPYEVSFDEFFGTDEDYDDEDEGEDVLQDELDDELADEGDDLADGELEEATGLAAEDDAVAQHESDAMSDATSEADHPADDGAHDGAEDEDEHHDEVEDQDEVKDGQEPADEPAKPQTQPSRRSGRPSVPSWDDIMFGSGGKKR